MLERPVSYLPPQDPNDYPYIKGGSSPTEGANSTENPTWPLPAPDNAGYPWAGQMPAGYPWAGLGPGGYPWNAPMPMPYGPYFPSMGLTPVPGTGWNDPVLMGVQRNRSASRKISLSSGIVGIITMIIQIIFTTISLAFIINAGQYDLPLAFFGLFVILLAPFVISVGCIATFILALIACIQAHSRTPRVQPDGWVEAKMPTSAMLATSIVAGLPTFIICVTWSVDVFEPVLVACGLAEVLIAVGFVLLLRKSKALDPSARAPQAPGTQPV